MAKNSSFSDAEGLEDGGEDVGGGDGVGDGGEVVDGVAEVKGEEVGGEGGLEGVLQCVEGCGGGGDGLGLALTRYEYLVAVGLDGGFLQLGYEGGDALACLCGNGDDVGCDKVGGAGEEVGFVESNYEMIACRALTQRDRVRGG